MNVARYTNPLKEHLRAGETLFGCFQRIPCPEITELCAYACFDFVVIDMEHSLVSEERVADLVRSADAAGIAALVRVPDGRPATIGRVLEAGLAGIQVPRIRSAEEVEDVVRATRYPPAGSRGLSAPKQTAYGTRVSLAEHVKASENSLLTVVQVEDRAALQEVENIAAVPGVDVIFIGLTDLSGALGVPGAYNDPALLEAVETAFRLIKGQGKTVAVPVTGVSMARDYLERGATYLTTTDVRLLLNSARAFLARLGRSA